MDDTLCGFDCPFEFASPEENQAHNMRHKTYKCRRCSFSTKELVDAQAHRQEKHDDIYCCPFCVFRTPDSRAYREHARRRACGARRQPAARDDDFSEEIDAEIEDNNLFCETCSIQFSRTAAWRSHMDAGHFYVVDGETQPTKPKRRSYPIQNVEEALEAVIAGGMPLLRAAKMYKVPRSTLRHAVKNGFHRQQHGPTPIFSEEEEEELVKFIVNIGRLDKTALLVRAKKLAKITKREHSFKNGTPGLRWFKCFVRRHPELKQYATRTRHNK